MERLKRLEGAVGMFYFQVSIDETIVSTTAESSMISSDGWEMHFGCGTTVAFRT